MRALVRSLIALLFLAQIACGGTPSQTSSTSGSNTAAAWTLVWSDEFEGASGTTPDATKWTMETGGNGWGNNELEYYTARTENVHQEAGNLVITARSEAFTGPDNVTRNFTSARLKTATHFAQQYGRFEAKIKIPAGQGIWPAFWMLGNDIDTAGWPTCGEIDIMENIAKEASIVHGTVHGPGYSGGNGISAAFTLPGGKAFADDFHVFAVEWEPNTIRFYVDGTLYQTVTPSSLPAGAHWAYDHPFFVLLNVAVGGNWPGSPDQTSVFPQSMLVDYVRVYSRK